ncbi:hypothetical protein Trco_003966 [Trichoderma cornu-damae]|uniref:Uncharacterized protein n=1 Tax=Trichoderma cornu-damae TaxID=654480 RepID=A0A9P8QR01_9HYPO|nr:hypothetical protein Trco_003966 [Trichoderma cornu-damae]
MNLHGVCIFFSVYIFFIFLIVFIVFIVFIFGYLLSFERVLFGMALCLHGHFVCGIDIVNRFHTRLCYIRSPSKNTALQ